MIEFENTRSPPHLPGEVLAMRIHVLLAPLLLGLSLSLPTAGASAAESRLDRINASHTVRACIWPDYYGITYRNPKTMQLSGIDIDMAHELGKDLGARVEFVDSSFARLIDDLTGDRCDIAMFGVGITTARLEKLSFSSPYLASDIYAIATKSNRRIKGWDDIDTFGSVVAVARGTLHEAVMKDKLSSAQLLILDTSFAREQEVQAGRADVFITDYPYSQRFLASNDWARLIAPPAKYHVTPYAYAIAKGDDAWQARIERFVVDVKRDGRLKEAAKRHKLEAILIP
jgi:ABC-type amino acid transport substrate-binding protein